MLVKFIPLLVNFNGLAVHTSLEKDIWTDAGTEIR